MSGSVFQWMQAVSDIKDIEGPVNVVVSVVIYRIRQKQGVDMRG